MGASNIIIKSNPSDVEEEQTNQSQIVMPQFSFEDVENNNNQCINVQCNELSFLPIHTFIDELNNNNTSLMNNNYLTVSLTSPSSTTLTTTTISKKKHNQPIQRLSELQTQLDNGRREKTTKSISKEIKSEKELLKEKEKKKKKKPKAPRAPGGPGAGGRGRGGAAEQDQMMRRPRRKNKDEK